MAQHIVDNSGNRGMFGEGLYVSKVVREALARNPHSDANKFYKTGRLLIFAGAPRNPYRCLTENWGAPCPPGYDCQTSPDGVSEVAFFEEHHIIPVAVVHYTHDTSAPPVKIPQNPAPDLDMEPLFSKLANRCDLEALQLLIKQPIDVTRVHAPETLTLLDYAVKYRCKRSELYLRHLVPPPK
jgi:hypothetical protein